MSETKEPELLPCFLLEHCKPISFAESSVWSSTAIRRTVKECPLRSRQPAPQWTADPPKEEGWYVYFIDNQLCFRYFREHAGFIKDVVVGNATTSFAQAARWVELSEQTIWWLKLSIPSIPERKECDK
jgi:hypothetical protein